jgi:hypothetical protein
VDDVVDVTNGALGEGVSDAPGCAGVGRGVDVDFVAVAIVEIFSPVNCAAYSVTRNRGEVERASTTDNCMGLAKFGFAGAKGHDRSRNGGDDSGSG